MLSKLSNTFCYILFLVTLTCISTAATFSNQDSFVQYIIQPVDHFNDYNTDTFELRYLIDERAYNSSNPTIFFYTGGEAGIDYYWNQSGITFRDWATQYGAIIIFCEHRFYGRSFPRETRANAFSLSVEQTLADFAALIQLKNDEYGHKFNVVTAGGSYAGELALYMRVKYPSLVNAAIGSSAPFMMMGYKYTEDHPMNFEYFRKVTSVFHQIDTRCPKMVVNAYSQMQKMFELKDYSSIQSALHLCAPPTTSTDLFQLQYFIQDLFAGLTQGNLANDDDSKSMPAILACNLLTQQDPSFPLNAIGRLFAFELGPIDEDQPCYNPFWSTSTATHLSLSTRPVLKSPLYSQYINSLPQKSYINTHNERGYTGGDDWSENKSWGYQMCTQTMYYLNTSGKNDTNVNMFPRIIESEKDFINSCLQSFNLPQASVENQWKKLSTNYPWSHSDWQISTTHVVYSNGLWDPWCGGGVNIGGHQGPTSLVINIPKAAHHIDLNKPTKNDLKDIQDIRKMEYDLISEYLKPSPNMTLVNTIADIITQRYPTNCFN